MAELKRSLGVGTGQTGSMTVMTGMPSMPLPAAIPPPARSRVPLILAAGGAVIVLGLIGLIALGRSAKPAEPGAIAPANEAVQIPANSDVSQAPPVSVNPPDVTPAGAGAALSGPVSTVPPPPANIGSAIDNRPAGEGARPTTSIPPPSGIPAASSSIPPAPGRSAGRDEAAAPPAAKPPVARDTSQVTRDAQATARDMPAVTPSKAEAAAPKAAEPPAPPVPASNEATLRVDFDGEPYQVTLFADDERIGSVGQPGTVTLVAGSIKVRAVAESVFLNAEIASLSLRPGDRKSITLPGLASAVLNVKGEDYTGVRIMLDGRQIPGPYPAQLGRVAAGTHNVVYRWVSGPSSGREIAKAVTFSARGHFLVRAVVDNADIVVQQLR